MIRSRCCPVKLSGIAINPLDGCVANIDKADSMSASLCIGMATVSTANVGAAASTEVTAQDARPEALCVSGDTERIYQDFRFLGDGLDDVPALLFGSGDE